MEQKYHLKQGASVLGTTSTTEAEKEVSYAWEDSEFWSSLSFCGVLWVTFVKIYEIFHHSSVEEHKLLYAECVIPV